AFLRRGARWSRKCPHCVGEEAVERVGRRLEIRGALLRPVVSLGRTFPSPIKPGGHGQQPEPPIVGRLTRRGQASYVTDGDSCNRRDPSGHGPIKVGPQADY